jgi:hypothetical protein
MSIDYLGANRLQVSAGWIDFESGLFQFDDELLFEKEWMKE